MFFFKREKSLKMKRCLSVCLIMIMAIAIVIAIPAQAETLRDWGSIMTLPTSSEVSAYNNKNKSNTDLKYRAPYVQGWLDTSDATTFSQYAIDFKADKVPKATYCSLANFRLDFSSRKTKYTEVYQDYTSVSGYCGFQRAPDGSLNLILSLWDVDDNVGAEFMTLFYETMLSDVAHMHKRAAFNKAKAIIRDKYPEPYYWAGFVMLD